MSYLDGFVIPVENCTRDAFIDHARRMDKVFLANGATRVVECWGVDLMAMPEGFEMPFDGKRMVYGGFEPVVVLGNK